MPATRPLPIRSSDGVWYAPGAPERNPAPRLAHDRAGHRALTGTGALAGQLWDHREQQLADAADVGVEDAQHLFVGDRLDAGLAFQAHVVIRDQRDVGVAELQLARQNRLRVLGHVDDFPAGAAEPLALRARGEARPLHHHHRAALVVRQAKLAARLDGDLAHLRAVRVRG